MWLYTHLISWLGKLGGSFGRQKPSGGRIALEVSFVVEQPGSLSCSLSAS